MLDREELFTYLSHATDDTDMVLTRASFDVFDKYNLPDYMDMYDMMVGESEDKSNEDFIVGFRALTVSTLKGLLRIQGITVSDEALWNQVIDLCNAVFDLPYFEDKESILAITTLSLNANETLAEMLKVSASLSIEETLTVLETVEDSVIERLIELLNGDGTVQEEMSEERVKVIDQCVKVYSQYKNYLDQKPCYADIYTVNPDAIGHPFDIYLKLYLQHVVAKMNPVDTGVVASDLVALACLSLEGYSNPMQVAKDAVEQITPDINLTTQLSVRIGEICGEAFRE